MHIVQINKILIFNLKEQYQLSEFLEKIYYNLHNDTSIIFHSYKFEVYECIRCIHEVYECI